jgi:hypothetical protein
MKLLVGITSFRPLALLFDQMDSMTVAVVSGKMIRWVGGLQVNFKWYKKARDGKGETVKEK